VTSFDALCDQLSVHRAVLALGGGHSAVAAGLRARGTPVHAVAGDWPSIQLQRRYPLVIVEPSGPGSDRVAVVHCAAQHVEPGGDVLVCGGGDEVAQRFDLRELARVAVEGVAIHLYRRTDRITIHDKVFAARSRISRVTAHELAARLQQPDAPTVVDTRTATDRGRFGSDPGFDPRAAHGRRMASRSCQRVPAPCGHVARSTARVDLQRRLQLVVGGGESPRCRLHRRR
jgi:hypothetical protein